MHWSYVFLALTNQFDKKITWFPLLSIFASQPDEILHLWFHNLKWSQSVLHHSTWGHKYLSQVVVSIAYHTHGKQGHLEVLSGVSQHCSCCPAAKAPGHQQQQSDPLDEFHYMVTLEINTLWGIVYWRKAAINQGSSSHLRVILWYTKLWKSYQQFVL